MAEPVWFRFAQTAQATQLPNLTLKAATDSSRRDLHARSGSLSWAEASEKCQNAILGVPTCLEALDCQRGFALVVAGNLCHSSGSSRDAISVDPTRSGEQYCEMPRSRSARLSVEVPGVPELLPIGVVSITDGMGAVSAVPQSMQNFAAGGLR